MIKTYLILTCLLASTIGFTQSINFQQDTTQTFQDADVGAMEFADVDNDGDKDVLITGKGGPVLTTLFLNDGSGNFSPSTSDPFLDVFDGDVDFLMLITMVIQMYLLQANQLHQTVQISI